MAVKERATGEGRLKGQHMRTADFLSGIADRLPGCLPPEWAAFQMQRRAQLLKIWYQEPRLHYEVWPVAGRDLVEVGLHFEAAAEVNLNLLRRFDPEIIAIKAALDGAVELEQWTASWGHLFRVYHAPVLDTALQAAVCDWLARLIPVSEPILQAAVAELGTVAVPASRPRDWAAWRQRRARRPG